MGRRPRFDPAAARAARLAAVLALMPAGLSAQMQAEWSALAEALADDAPPLDAGRYRTLMLQYCAVKCRHDAYASTLATINLEIYREKTPGGRELVKVHPYVALRDRSAAEMRTLADMLELSPRAVRKRKARVSLFDAA